MYSEAFYNYWQTWFAQPMAAKMERSRLEGKGGYSPPFSEQPGYTGQPDPKEYYSWSIEKDDPDNRFDADGSTPTQIAFWQCWDTAVEWCVERGLERVVDVVNAADCRLRILHYLPTPDGLAGQEHVDYDLLTVNVGGTCPGLEVEERINGNWRGPKPGVMGPPISIPVWTPREGGVHVGEMLEIYTRAQPFITKLAHVATTHHVRLPPNTERLAAVFFYLPPMDFVLRPGLTANQYLHAKPGERADGHVGVLVRAGTAAASAVKR